MSPSPRFQQIKQALLEQIERRELQPGAKVPSENQLAEQFRVSRMTARRALTELVDAQVLIRNQGAGTFVADQRPISSIFTITSIDQEIRQRGHEYACQLLELCEVPANTQSSLWLDIPSGAPLYYLQVVHFEQQQPVQLERRWVSPQAAPAFIEQDFTRCTAHQYLSEVAPLSEADHQIEALLPSADVASHLQITHQHPCLLLSRRTFSNQGQQKHIVSYAHLFHPGQRYRLGGHLDF